MKGYLYLITNLVNQKKYVGKTYASIESRFKDHIKKSKTGIDRPLYRAIAKYGKDAFKLELLGEYEQGVLEEKEIELIKTLDTYNNGYNATLGGDGKRYCKYSDEEVIKLYIELQSFASVSRKLFIAEETVRKIIRSNNIPENKNSLQQAMTKACGKRVKHVETGIVYESMSDCARALIEAGFVERDISVKSISNSISRVISGARKSYKKMTFIGV